MSKQFDGRIRQQKDGKTTGRRQRNAYTPASGASGVDHRSAGRGGGQIWLLLKLFLAPITSGEGRAQFSVGPLDEFPVGSVKYFPERAL